MRRALGLARLARDHGNHPFGALLADAAGEVLLEAERCAVRTWSEICDITFGKDYRTYDIASRILQEEIEHEAWFIELLSMERDGVVRPSGHFRRGAPGEAPYSKNAGFYNP